MIRILSVENMRNSDAATIAAGTPGRELMFRAGRAIFDSVNWKPPVAILCGSGNNAGDGYVIAKLLHDAEIACVLILLSEKFSEDGAYYYSLCKEAGIPSLTWDASLDLSEYGTIVDCLFGTGFRGEVRGSAREAIDAVNRSGACVIAVDINSGLNGDSGMAETCVHSDLTVSVGSFQPGHFLNMAKDVMKAKINCDIGIEPVDRTYALIESSDLAELFQPRKNHSNKGTYGYSALIGGSKRYSGAIRLAGMANAAMRAGAGVVKLAVPDVIFSTVAPAVLESTLFPLSDDGNEIVFSEKEIAELVSNVKTVAFGMGIGTGEGAGQTLEYLLEHYAGRLIVDADGLNLLSRMDLRPDSDAAYQGILPADRAFHRRNPEQSHCRGGSIREGKQGHPAAERSRHRHHGRGNHIPHGYRVCGHGDRGQRRRTERHPGSHPGLRGRSPPRHRGRRMDQRQSRRGRTKEIREHQYGGWRHSRFHSGSGPECI